MARGNVTVKIEGIEALGKRLREVSDRASAEQTLRAALQEAGELVRDTASQKAPVGTEFVTRPRLQDGLKVVHAKRIREKGLWYRIAPTVQVSHAILQEFGTRHHPAKPFMLPAYDERRQDAVDAVKDKVRRAITDAIRVMK